jgi:ABC-type transporter Mla subunit MlaD
MPSLLKDPLVVIYQGDEGKRPLPPGSTLEGAPMPSFSMLMSEGNKLLSSLQEILGKENQAKIQKILDEVESVATTAREMLDSIGGDVQTLIKGPVAKVVEDASAFTEDLRKLGPKAVVAADQVNETLTDVRGVVSKTGKVLDDFQVALGKLSVELQGAVVDMRELLQNANGLVVSASLQVIATLETAQTQIEGLRYDVAGLVGSVTDLIERNGNDIDRIVDNVALTTEHVEQLTRTLKRSPWKLIWKTPPKHVAPGGEPEWIIFDSTPEQNAAAEAP